MGYAMRNTWVVLVAGLTLCLSSWAGNGTWISTASEGLWSATENWDRSLIADGYGATAFFNTRDLAADTRVYLDGPRALANLMFGDTDTNSVAGWVFDDMGADVNILTLAGVTPTITVQALGENCRATIRAKIAGSAGLTKAGAGTLELTEVNTYTGATVVTGGILVLSGSGALATNTSIMINGGIVDMGAQNTVYNPGNNTGIVFGPNGGIYAGSGTNTIMGSSGALNAFTVPVNALATVNANVNITNTSAAANYSGIASVGAGSTLIINGKVISANSGGELWLRNAGTLKLNNTGNYFAGIGISEGGTLSTTNFSALGWYNFMVLGQDAAQPPATFIYTGPTVTTTFSFWPECLEPRILNNGSGTVTFSASTFNGRYGAPTSAMAQRLTLGGSSDIVISGTIKDANASSYRTMLVKTNANTLTLTGTNVFSAGTVIRGGTLQLGDGTSGRDGSILGNIQNDALLAYNPSRTQTVVNSISGTGMVMKIGSGIMMLASTNTYSGLTMITAGTLKLGHACAITNNGAIAVSGGVYDLAGFTVTNGAITLGSGTIANGTLVGSSYACTNAGLVTANLAGSGELVKTGAGSLVLRGVNSFTGPVTITGGLLELQSSPAEGSAVWLDATALSSMAKNTDGTGGMPAPGDGVGRWTSLSASNWVSSSSKPTYQTNVIHGQPVLRFAGSMTFSSNVIAQGSTIFMVYRQTGNLGNWLQPLDTSGGQYLHMINNSNFRCFVRGGGAIGLNSTVPSTNWAVQAVQIQTNDYRLWVDGAAYGPSMATNEFSAFDRVNLQGDVAEILVYTNLLSATARTTTLSYLRKKWLGMNSSSSVTNSLAPSLFMKVMSGSTLDLWGGDQMLAGLEGSGWVSNGAITVTARVMPGDTSSVAGVLSIGGNLTLAAGVTNTFDYVGEGADSIHVTGTLTVQGPNTVEVILHGQRPPAEMKLFTFSELKGDTDLSSWTVQGPGFEGYQTRIVRKDSTTIVLKTALMGSLIKLL